MSSSSINKSLLYLILIRKLCLVGAFSFVRALVWDFLASYGDYFPGAFLFVVASCTVIG